VIIGNPGRREQFRLTWRHLVGVHLRFPQSKTVASATIVKASSREEIGMIRYTTTPHILTKAHISF
jgi:hypothetical protein